MSEEPRRNRRKVAITVYLNQMQMEDIRKLHDLSKVPIAEIIRQGVDRIIKEKGDEFHQRGVAWRQHVIGAEAPTDNKIPDI